MSTELKTYDVNVAFNSMHMRVKAPNKIVARLKAKLRVIKMILSNIQYLYIDES